MRQVLGDHSWRELRWCWHQITRLQATEDMRTLDLLTVPHAEDANAAYQETREQLSALSATGRPVRLVLTPEEARRRMRQAESKIIPAAR